jgi:hypothetical protein
MRQALLMCETFQTVEGPVLEGQVLEGKEAANLNAG